MSWSLVHMAPPEIDKAGADLAQMTDDARRTTDRLFASTDTAVTRNNGWLATPATKRCGDQWHHKLNALINNTSALALSISHAARLYNSADQETANRIRDVLGNMAAR